MSRTDILEKIANKVEALLNLEFDDPKSDLYLLYGERIVAHVELTLSKRLAEIEVSDMTVIKPAEGITLESTVYDFLATDPFRLPGVAKTLPKQCVNKAKRSLGRLIAEQKGAFNFKSPFWSRERQEKIMIEAEVEASKMTLDYFLKSVDHDEFVHRISGRATSRAVINGFRAAGYPLKTLEK